MPSVSRDYGVNNTLRYFPLAFERITLMRAPACLPPSITEPHTQLLTETTLGILIPLPGSC